MHLDNYIAKNLTNVTLSVLEGEVVYSDEKQPYDVVIPKGSSVPIRTGQFHKVTTTSAYPACYMYTCTKGNDQESETDGYLTIRSISILASATSRGYPVDFILARRK